MENKKLEVEMIGKTKSKGKIKKS